MGQYIVQITQGTKCTQISSLLSNWAHCNRKAITNIPSCLCLGNVTHHSMSWTRTVKESGPHQHTCQKKLTVELGWPVTAYETHSCNAKTAPNFKWPTVQPRSIYIAQKYRRDAGQPGDIFVLTLLDLATRWCKHQCYGFRSAVITFGESRVALIVHQISIWIRVRERSWKACRRQH